MALSEVAARRACLKDGRKETAYADGDGLLLVVADFCQMPG